jgi:UDP-glucose:(heptosyl)LPS alpha-1,3-glucosyltransferase
MTTFSPDNRHPADPCSGGGLVKPAGPDAIDGPMVLIRSTYSPFGGAERVAMSLLEGLLARDRRVVLLTLPGQNWPVDHPNLRVEAVGMQGVNRLVQAWSFNRGVGRYLSRHPAACILSLDKVSHFTHLHAGGGTHRSFLAIRNRYSGRLSAAFRRWSLFHRYTLHLEKMGFENPSLVKVRCNSRMVREDIVRNYGVAEEKLVVIHSGIHWQKMQETFTRRGEVGEDLCRRHGIDPAWASLLFLGSGFSRKGLDIAIRGLRALPDAAHLIVVGKGAPGPYLRLAGRLGVEGRIHFLGPQSRGWRYASCCRAVVLPSRYDPFGGASAEGHAMGLPVLVSDKTGYADRVDHGENGIVVASPMDDARITEGFRQLWGLIRHPKWTPDQLRKHAEWVDDEAVLDRLFTEFLPA